MRKFILKLFMSLLLISCVKRPVMQLYVDTGSLEGLKGVGSIKSPSNPLSDIKAASIREAALSIGAQSGLAWSAKIIDDELIKQARILDAIFDFNALILDHNILPPVLLEGRNTLNLADDQTIRISDRTYKIKKQARFITTPPNWRQYIWMDYKKPECPSSSTLPRNNTEKQIWDRFVEQGWNNGVEQAHSILEESLARIKEDFNGMILYRKLLAMNMVSPPYVSNIDLGITGDSQEMHIDDKVLRITALPLLNLNSKEWRAVVTKDETAIEQFNKLEKSINEAKITISSKAWQPVIAPVN